MCRPTRSVVYGLIALARAKFELLITKEETGVPQLCPENIEFPLSARAVADFRR